MVGKTIGLYCVLAALMMLAIAGNAQAGSVGSQMILDGTTTNIASDESVEYLVDAATSGTANVIDVGDILRGAINMNTLNSSGANLGGSTGNNQWTGVFSIKVTGIASLGGGQYRLTFGPDAGFASWLATLDVDTGTAGVQAPNGPSLATGTMIRMWESTTSTVDFTGSSSADVNIATAATGSFFWDLGFTPSPSGETSMDGSGNLSATEAEGWVGTGAIALDPTLESSASFGNSNFLLSLLQNGLGPDIKPKKLSNTLAASFGLDPTKTWYADFSGSVNVRGPGDAINNGFDLTDNAQFQFLAVPVPAAAWTGLMMLLGLGAVRIRRRRAAN